MEIKEYTRKVFSVMVAEVTLANYREVAQWCGGEVVMEPTKMMGTTADLPVIKLKGQGDDRGREVKAVLGAYIAELNGNFRVYKPAQFSASFDEKPDGKVVHFPEYDPNSTVNTPENDEAATLQALEVSDETAVYTAG